MQLGEFYNSEMQHTLLCKSLPSLTDCIGFFLQHSTLHSLQMTDRSPNYFASSASCRPFSSAAHNASLASTTSTSY